MACAKGETKCRVIFKEGFEIKDNIFKTKVLTGEYTVDIIRITFKTKTKNIEMKERRFLNENKSGETSRCK